MSTERKESPKHKATSMFSPKANKYNHHFGNNYQTNKSSSLLLLTKESELSSLKTKLIIQSNILKEYETWVNILLSIINSKSSNETYSDLGTPIQKGLEHICKIQTDNIKVKEKLIDEISKNKKKEYELQEKETTFQWGKVEFNISKADQIAFERNQLLNNIQLMANELDEQSEKNKNLNEVILKEENMAYYNTVNEYIKLRNDNLILKQVIELQNDKNKCLYLEQQQHDSFQNKNHLYTSTQYSLTSRRLGNYLIEEEEDRNDFGLFTCKKLE